MNNPVLYNKQKGLQQSDSIYVIENYLKQLKWNSSKSIVLDIGSGDGQTLCEILLPKIESKIEKVIGVDVSSDMVNFARKQFGKSDTAFEKMNIETVDVPVEFYEKFDNIFSFFCLHWIINQRVAFKNIFEMLKPKGYVLLTFLAKNPVYDMYHRMANMDKWALYMKDYKKFISPYHYSENPVKELRELMEKIGFKIEICKAEKRSYTFPSMENLVESVRAINPFLSKIPEEKHSEYFEDYVDLMRKIGTVKIEKPNNNEEETIECCYELFVVVAKK